MRKLKNPKPKPTISFLKKKAQTLFNTYIRNRDKIDSEWTCISCGLTIDKCNAGHYIPVRPYEHLRYNEDNCHAQCIRCNLYAQGNFVGYRKNLIEKIGLERVTKLEESAFTSVPFTKDMLIDIINKYR